jgi:hypothetical protein
MTSAIDKVVEAHEGEDLYNNLAYELEHITIRGGMCGDNNSFSQAWGSFRDQRCSGTPQCVTTEWDI